MSVECLVFTLGVIVQITSFDAWYQFAIGRFISGLGVRASYFLASQFLTSFQVGALSAAVPMYQAETSPSQIRGTLTATYQLFITLGILVAYCISIGTRAMDNSGSWRTVVGIGIFWALVLGVGILFMPESPRWSARHGNLDAARSAIAKVRGISIKHPLVESEMSEILQSLDAERQVDIDDDNRNASKTGESSVSTYEHSQGDVDTQKNGARGGRAGTWLECFIGFKKSSSRVGYRTILGMSLQSLQQLTGANYLYVPLLCIHSIPLFLTLPHSFYYGATIFVSVGIEDSFVTQIILGAVNFICTFGGLYVMEKVCV